MLHLDLTKSLQGAEGPLTFQVRLDIPWGECLALHGPSGAGKTSLLRMVAGLLTPDAGEIRLDQQPWHLHDTRLPIQQRRCGLVFQQYALFPRMRVRAQLRYAQAQEDLPAIDQLIAALGLNAIADQYPAQLSGGQQQRVAFARALAARPRVLLLDEPFSAQDADHAAAMRALLQSYHAAQPCITLLASHAIADAFQLADRVALLDRGRLVALGTPDTVFTGTPDAEVVQLQSNENEWLASLLVNGKLSEVRLPRAEYPDLRVGSRVPVRLHF